MHKTIFKENVIQWVKVGIFSRIILLFSNTPLQRGIFVM
jgi:hypothetical protein